MTRTIGVAIAIPEPYGGQLQAHRERFGDPSARSIPTHVTLLPPTEVAVTERPMISAHLEEVARCHPPFDMHLAGTGTFSPVSEVVFVAVARGIGSCELIANDVRRGPLARSLSFPYHPHVTVAHDVPRDMLDFAYSGLADLSAEFRVDRFTEFEQVPGGAWAVAREYPLTGPPR